jgi:hypothetical protein
MEAMSLPVFSGAYGAGMTKYILLDYNLLHPPAPNPSIGLKVAL